MNKFYRVGDYLKTEEVEQFQSLRDIRAVATGEKRPPKKGEWYLSGAVATAYRAPNDFLPSMSYQIARLVEIETVTIVREKK